MTPKEILSRNLRRAVSKDVGLAGILLYIPAEICVVPNRVAWTDGQKTYFAEEYFKYEPEEQVAIAIHEGLHVALRHVQRGKALAVLEGQGYDPQIWNIACDVVINQAIRNCHWCVLPKDACLPEHCLLATQLQKRAAQLWTAEEIYSELKRDKDAYKKLLSNGAGSFICDLDVFRGPFSPAAAIHVQSMEEGIWRERLVRAQVGLAPGSVLRRLSADVPKPKVRWESVLRSFLSVRLMPVTETSWSRPSRRTLSLGTHAQFLDPGMERQRGLRRAGIVVDTSGSIDDGLLHTFIAEINSIMVKTGCEVVLVNCDAEVQQVSTHRVPIRGYTAKGGGGTDFRPALEHLRRFPLDVAVYFTDLEGTFPEKRPPFPLLWAVTKELAVPFGQKVLLPARGTV